MKELPRDPQGKCPAGSSPALHPEGQGSNAICIAEHSGTVSMLRLGDTVHLYNENRYLAFVGGEAKRHLPDVRMVKGGPSQNTRLLLESEGLHKVRHIGLGSGRTGLGFGYLVRNE